jgi:solute carrier family 35 protein E4
MGLLLMGCVNALVYNLVHTLVIKITSSVTTTVIGEMKIILILVLSAVILGEWCGREREGEAVVLGP